LLKHVVIDLSNADIIQFEKYEKQVLPLLKKHGALMKLAIRSLDERTETHVLYFPDANAFDSFIADPGRALLQDDWSQLGAVASVTDVKEISYPLVLWVM